MGVVSLPGFGITLIAATFQARESIPAQGTYWPSLEQSQIPENGSLAYAEVGPPGRSPSFGWLTTPVGSPSDFRMIRIVSIDTVIREKVSARRVADSSDLLLVPSLFLIGHPPGFSVSLMTL
ncbi:hypothetical protein EVAR_65702_1 [Eumeta japonica]|uniref:Uncharacterized protein n=1 Tax=Eumeta variegata TaxID=151549 RepID=A0A4C2A987_EUMVA|nr:hypothetical protein EVAR_65702_1 [Eumeta japonica]